MATNVSGRIAAVLLGLETIGVIALTVWQVVALVTGDVGSLSSAIALIVLTAVAAAAMAAFAGATWRDASWGRSGGIVMQVLVLAIGVGAATGAYADPLVGASLAVPAIVTLVLLVLAARHAARARERG